MWIFAAVNLLLDFGNIAMFFVSKDPATGKWKLSCSSCSLCSRDNTGKSNLNMLSALAHVTADTLRSVAVMVGPRPYPTARKCGGGTQLVLCVTC